MKPSPEALRQYKRRNTLMLVSFGAIVLLVILSSLLKTQPGPAVSPPSLSATPTGSWSPAGSMATGREFPDVTRLVDGSVLVTGGFAKDQRVGNAELFNPTLKSWSAAGSLQVARTGDVPVVLPSGNVMVIGGYDGKVALASTEVFDPGSKSWSPGPAMHTARTSFTATILANGRVLVAGGYDGTNDLNSVEIYDPTTRAWTDGSPMLEARSGHMGLLLKSGQVLILTGQGGTAPAATAQNDQRFLRTSELYDPAANTWTQSGSTSVTYDQATAAVLNDGRVLLNGEYFMPNSSGGFVDRPKTELYDSSSGQWSVGKNTTTIRLHYTMTQLGNGSILMAGGLGSTSVQPIRTAEVYDPAVGAWAPTASMSIERQAHAAVAMRDGSVLVVGGVGPDLRPIASAEIFTPFQ